MTWRGMKIVLNHEKYFSNNNSTWHENQEQKILMKYLTFLSNFIIRRPWSSNFIKVFMMMPICTFQCKYFYQIFANCCWLNLQFENIVLNVHCKNIDNFIIKVAWDKDISLLFRLVIHEVSLYKSMIGQLQSFFDALISWYWSLNLPCFNLLLVTIQQTQQLLFANWCRIL